MQKNIVKLYLYLNEIQSFYNKTSDQIDLKIRV